MANANYGDTQVSIAAEKRPFSAATYSAIVTVTRMAPKASPDSEFTPLPCERALAHLLDPPIELCLPRETNLPSLPLPTSAKGTLPEVLRQLTAVSYCKPALKLLGEVSELIGDKIKLVKNI